MPPMVDTSMVATIVEAFGEGLQDLQNRHVSPPDTIMSSAVINLVKRFSLATARMVIDFISF